ncbi:ABC transporter permease subunit [Labrenzia aggregata]|uniref:ABC transporter permease subunit n=1 Tax=Roseibium aggregatum TaxID=187304 RepID=A0A926S8D5_9HYPH|nr:ABC transporter permease subunit [Roseibium aggregatum]
MLLLIAGPVCLGLAGTLLPAFGYLPALGGSVLSLDPFRAVLSEPGIGLSLALSLGTGLAATAISLAIVALFTAAWFETRVFKAMTRFLSPLLSVPHAAAAIGLAFVIAPSGLIVRLLSPWATGFDRPPDLLIIHDPLGLTMTAGLIAKEVPFLFLMTLAALPQTEARRHLRIAANLGYGRMAGFFKVALPQIYPQIRLPVLAVLAYSTSVVDVARILGPTTPAPLAPRIIDWMADADPALRLQASAGAVLQLLLSVGAILIWRFGEILCSRIARSGRSSGRRYSRDAAMRQMAAVPVGLLIAAMVAALAALALWSLTAGWWFPQAFPTALTLRHWAGLFPGGSHLVGDTLLIALPAAVVAIALIVWQLELWTRTGPRRRHAAFRNLMFLPLLVPQISFLFGLQVLFLVAGWDGTYVAVALTHLVFVLPYVFLALSDPWDHLDPRLAKVAATLGASQNRILWSIRLPMLLRPLMVAAAIGFAVSIGQYLPTLMIGAGRIATITTESVALASGGSRSVAAVYAMLQLMLPLLGFVLASVVPAIAFRHRLALRLQR